MRPWFPLLSFAGASNSFQLCQTRRGFNLSVENMALYIKVEKFFTSTERHGDMINIEAYAGTMGLRAKYIPENMRKALFGKLSS